MTGGPAGCEAWAKAYSTVGTVGPCDTCPFRGQLKNPAVQLGAIVDVTPPGAAALNEPEAVVEWVAEINKQFAIVRHGSKAVAVDFQTPTMTARGVVYGLGFLDVSAFRSLMNGKYAPIEQPGTKAVGLVDAWLKHPQRRQYAGLVFAPGDDTLPRGILNLWTGYAVDPVPGDVSVWLELLEAMVPSPTLRAFVLLWLARKIQNPGDVPDTVLIFMGAKGTGKNSLFDPLITLFGRHAMLAADPELIAGRFTWHLMTLCFAVLDEAVFVGDPKQADRIKSRITAKDAHYEQKGMDPMQGVNRCAFVMLTNHDHVWQATADERRAVVVEVGESLRGDFAFWTRYHAWVKGSGPAALLHYLQRVDVSGFNPRQIPKGESLRQQIELTALRDPGTAWWHQCLSEGEVRCRDGVYPLSEGTPTRLPRNVLRESYEQSAAARQNRNGRDWAAVSKKLKSWAGGNGVRAVRAPALQGVSRGWLDELPTLGELRDAFTEATKVKVSP